MFLFLLPFAFDERHTTATRAGRKTNIDRASQGTHQAGNRAFLPKVLDESVTGVVIIGDRQRRQFPAVYPVLLCRQKRIYRFSKTTTDRVEVFRGTPGLNCVSGVEILPQSRIGIGPEVIKASFDLPAPLSGWMGGEREVGVWFFGFLPLRTTASLVLNWGVGCGSGKQSTSVVSIGSVFADRRGDRVADCAALEMLCAGNRTGGSNPPLSAFDFGLKR